MTTSKPELREDQERIVQIGGYAAFQAAEGIPIITGFAVDDLRTVEASEEAEEAWVQTILAKGDGMPIGGPGCTPGYYNNEGQPSPGARQASPYGGGSIEFFQLLEKWRADGSFDGLEFSA